jgi:hypothetical protein
MLKGETLMGIPWPVLAGIAIIVIACLLALKLRSRKVIEPIVHEVDDNNWREDIRQFVLMAPTNSTLVTHLHMQWRFARELMHQPEVHKKFTLKLGNKPASMDGSDVDVIEGSRGHREVNLFFKRVRIGDELVVVNRRVRIFALRRRKQYGFEPYGFGDYQITVRAPEAGEFPYLLGPYSERD